MKNLGCAKEAECGQCLRKNCLLQFLKYILQGTFHVRKPLCSLKDKIQYFDTYHLPRSNELHKCLTIVLYQTHHFHDRPEFLSNTIDNFP